MRRPAWTERLPAAAAAAAGLSFGASLFFGGYHELTSWGPLALVWLAVLLGLALGRPALPRGAALAALAGLLALGLWALISTGWAESADRAGEEANRWLLYAVVLAALLLLLRGASLERVLLVGAVTPILALAVYLLARMLLGDADSLFLNNRLNEPFGYVNGLACSLLLGFWPLIAVAERADSRLVQGGAVAGAVALAGLVVMTQSRGALLAFVASAVVLLAIVPGRLRRGWALVVVGAAVAACAPFLSDVVAALPPEAQAPAGSDVEAAAGAVVIAALLAGAIWVGANLAAESLSSSLGERRGRTISAVAIGTLAAIGLAATALPVDERYDDVRDQYDAFTELQPVGTGVRFASGGGNRYDYWRVAIDQFEEHPLRGEGAGNYDSDYFLERRTDESIRQAHSIELQALGEIGLVGGLALLVFIGGALAGLWRRSRAAADGYEPGLAVAGGGAFLIWLTHTSVDWMHLIPGLTGVALCGAAVLLAPSMRELEIKGVGPRRAAAGAVAAAVLALSALIAIATLAAQLRSQGTDELDSNPEAALEDARDSLSLNDESLPAYYLEAAALARLGEYEQARLALLEATRREPSDFVSWGLLGDLAARRGDLRAAQEAYARASELNPRDARLAELAASTAAIRAFAMGSEASPGVP